MISLAYGMGMLLALDARAAARRDARSRRSACGSPEARPDRLSAAGAARPARRRRNRRTPVSRRGAGGGAGAARRRASISRPMSAPTRYGSDFPARDIHMIPSATVRGRNPISLAQHRRDARHRRRARRCACLRRMRPAAVVGFGGYPTVPPVLAATLRGIPTLIHEQNAVMGRANRLLGAARRRDRDELSGCARSRADTRRKGDAAPAIRCGRRWSRLPASPIRRRRRGRVQLAGVRRQPGRARHGRHRAARGRAARTATCARGLPIVQQAREEDLARVREAYARLGVTAEVAPFFSDLPARIAAAHLVVSRSGASTVAELAAIGRPAILVPLPHALDQDQLANADVLAEAGGAIVLQQAEFTPERLAAEIAALASATAKGSPRWPRPPARRRARCRRAARRSGAARAQRTLRAGKSACRLRRDDAKRMKLPRDIGPIHFVGIGGIGMSGIAEVLVNLGYTVQGSDAADSANVKRLRDKGAECRDRPRGGQSRRCRSGGRLDRDQARQSGACRGARQAAAGGAPRRDAGRADAAASAASPSPARTARPRPPRWSRRCSMPAASIRP